MSVSLASERYSVEVPRIATTRLVESSREVIDAVTRDYIPLSSLLVEFGTPVPRRVRFPEGLEIHPQRWATFLISTVGWLDRKGLLTPELVPICATARGRLQYVLNATPFHARKPMIRAVKVGSYFVECHADAPHLFSWTKHLLETCGVSLDEVWVLPSSTRPGPFTLNT